MAQLIQCMALPSGVEVLEQAQGTERDALNDEDLDQGAPEPIGRRISVRGGVGHAMQGQGERDAQGSSPCGHGHATGLGRCPRAMVGNPDDARIDDTRSVTGRPDRSRVTAPSGWYPSPEGRS